MALSHQRVVQQSQATQQIASEAASLLAKIKYLLAINSDLSIDWTADPLPAYITEDTNGNISGVQFGRAQVANAVFSLDQIRATLENEAITQGDHLGNLNQLAQSSIYQ